MRASLGNLRKFTDRYEMYKELVTKTNEEIAGFDVEISGARLDKKHRDKFRGKKARAEYRLGKYTKKRDDSKEVRDAIKAELRAKQQS
ncbi:MAG: hypothetical protein QF824_04615 [Candidatus Woesearchaeota archaeon]|jgi:hypothetical protein|nr:hypothetical protein [Candidatus Woesearchaeota archaeon]